MDGALRQAREHAALAVDGAFDGVVVGKHRDDGVATAGIGKAVRDLGAPRCKCFRLRARSIVHCQLVSGLEDIVSDPGAHLPQADKSDLHFASPLILRVIQTFNGQLGKYEFRHTAVAQSVEMAINSGFQDRRGADKLIVFLASFRSLQEWKCRFIRVPSISRSGFF